MAPAFPFAARRGRLAGPVAAVVLAGCAASAAPGPASPPAPHAPPAVAPAAAPPEDDVDVRFARWVADFRATARAAGIDDATLHAGLDGVRFLPQLLAQDRAQPEFTRPVWDYLDRAVSPQRVERGAQKLAEVRDEAQAAAARHGVPPSVLVAIWGIESNYGSDFGDTPVIDALATLGFEGRRAAWATRELIAALQILQRGDVDRAQMVGSWAGAMGHTQFLPSTLLAYAEDADGDGRRDLWHSLADVLASTANVLARAGWRADEPWGVEVRLPQGFDVGAADGERRQDAAAWAAEGVQGFDGALPAVADAAILLPAGAQGPAFLVGANFRALLRYNNSTSYALAVGLLAQRLAGGPQVRAAWPRGVAPLARTDVQALQEALNARGFASGAPDGVIGPATRAALRRYQRSEGLPADGFATPELLERLRR